MADPKALINKTLSMLFEIMEIKKPMNFSKTYLISWKMKCFVNSLKIFL